MDRNNKKLNTINGQISILLNINYSKECYNSQWWITYYILIMRVGIEPRIFFYNILMEIKCLLQRNWKMRIVMKLLSTFLIPWVLSFHFLTAPHFPLIYRSLCCCLDVADLSLSGFMYTQQCRRNLCEKDNLRKMANNNKDKLGHIVNEIMWQNGKDCAGDNC